METGGSIPDSTSGQGENGGRAGRHPGLDQLGAYHGIELIGGNTHRLIHELSINHIRLRNLILLQSPKVETFTRIFKILALIVFCVGGTLVTWSLVRIARGTGPVSSPGPSNADVIATVLAGLTVSVALLAIMIGFFAIWGYQTITSEARSLAKQLAQRGSDEYLRGSELGERIRALVAEELGKLTEGAKLSTSQPLDTKAIIKEGESAEKVGEPYPEKGGDK